MGLSQKPPLIYKTPLWPSRGGAVRFVYLAGVAGENPGRLELPCSMVEAKSKSELPDLQCLPTTAAEEPTAAHARATTGWERVTKYLSPGGRTPPRRAVGRTPSPRQSFAMGTART